MATLSAARLGALFATYKVPILVGTGGIVAYSAYASAQARARAAAIAASQPSSGAAGLDPSQVGGLIGQGAGIAVATQGPILDLAGQSITGGLNLAGLAAQTAAGIADVAVGGSVAGSMALADVLGQVIGVLPSFAPAEGIEPQPTTLPPTTSPPSTSPTAAVFLRYEVYIPAPAQINAFIVSSTGALAPRRLVFSAPSFTTVSRQVHGGRLHWKATSGGYSGISYVPGLSTPAGAWAIRKRYRRADGSTYTLAISQSGS